MNTYLLKRNIYIKLLFLIINISSFMIIVIFCLFYYSDLRQSKFYYTSNSQYITEGYLYVEPPVYNSSEKLYLVEEKLSNEDYSYIAHDQKQIDELNKMSSITNIDYIYANSIMYTGYPPEANEHFFPEFEILSDGKYSYSTMNVSKDTAIDMGFSLEYLDYSNYPVNKNEIAISESLCNETCNSDKSSALINNVTYNVTGIFKSPNIDKYYIKAHTKEYEESKYDNELIYARYTMLTNKKIDNIENFYPNLLIQYDLKNEQEVFKQVENILPESSLYSKNYDTKLNEGVITDFFLSIFSNKVFYIISFICNLVTLILFRITQKRESEKLKFYAYDLKTIKKLELIEIIILILKSLIIQILILLILYFKMIDIYMLSTLLVFPQIITIFTYLIISLLTSGSKND